nr:protein gurken-like [Drosophila bipectinata]
MMPIPILQIIKVIFVLSTIVAVTDCCSSRILLLREHTLNIVQHQHNHLHEHAHELQQQEMAFASQWKLQQLQEQQQLEAAAQEAAMEANTDLDQNIDPFRAQLVETSTESSLASEIPSSSTETWSAADSSTPVTSEITTTPSTTVTHTGEPPPDQSTSSTFAVNPTTLPSVDEDKRKNATEVLLLPCSEEYKANFCLCKDDYVGERCEYKNWNGGFVYAPPIEKRKVRMAHIVFSFPVHSATQICSARRYVWASGQMLCQQFGQSEFLNNRTLPLLR